MSRWMIVTTIMVTAMLSGCSSEPADKSGTAPTAATPAAGAVDTLSGAKYADYRGDPVKGEAAFVQCKACHVIDAGVNRTGPSLHAVVDRKAGSIEGFHYSPAMRSSGITWTEAKLFEYLEAPMRVVPGTTMGYGGMSDSQKRADLIAYLKANGS